MQNLGHQASSHGLEYHGLDKGKISYWNLSTPKLLEQALQHQEGELTRHGAFIALTGEHTGRSPNDRFVVQEDSTKGDIWWGTVNRPIAAEKFEGLRSKMIEHLTRGKVFVQDCYAGADPANRLKVRVVTENAWHSLFARNMFIQPTEDELGEFEPEFTVLQAPSLTADPATDGTTSGTFILVD
ncbi:MAG: phosphoenolpyruvate carboxykinase (ATP), partial [Pseudomonadota bacterium]|nr:phosphoenolpyruvate carboxykinase (ATP) [Pseudomonadota bacterium]